MPGEPLERHACRRIQRIASASSPALTTVRESGEGHARHTGRVCPGAGDLLPRGDVEEMHGAVAEAVGERATVRAERAADKLRTQSRPGNPEIRRIVAMFQVEIAPLVATISRPSAVPVAAMIPLAWSGTR